MNFRKHINLNANPDFKYYVYIYLNPLKPGKYVYNKWMFDYEPFYVGLGSGNRMNNHIANAKNETDRYYQSAKSVLIREILNKKLTPVRFKLYEKLTRESADRIERYLIRLIGRNASKKGPLTNVTIGGNDDIKMKYRDYLMYGEDYLIPKKINCPNCTNSAKLKKGKGTIEYKSKSHDIISCYYKCSNCKLEFTTSKTDSSAAFQAQNQNRFPNYRSEDWGKLYPKKYSFFTSNLFASHSLSSRK